jgi:hypothetical protein
MRIILTSSADTTLYQRFPTTNSGLDEILEVGKVAAPEDLGIAYTGSSARTLINFTLPASGSTPATASYFLNLKIANAEKLPINQQILVYRVSSSWTEGSGYFIQKNNVRIPLYSGSTYLGDFDPTKIIATNDGATWRQATTAVSWSVDGGSIVTTPSQSVTLSEYPLQDLRIDVSSIMQPVVSQSLNWYGLALRFPPASDNDQTNAGNIKFFSRQTHTVHAPTLEILWNNAVFTTGSLKPIPNTSDIIVVPRNAAETYIRGTKQKIRFVVRDKYPQKNFDATLRYKNKYYLPQTSYVSVVDYQAGTSIVSFDNGSKIECDATGSYFVLDTTPLYKNRYYKISLNINNGDEDNFILPELFTFIVK